jgi:CheY-like chemotaxis protein
VLVIDDDSQIRALTVEMLEAEGYQVDSAADGTAGLSIGKAAEFHGIPVVTSDLVVFGSDDGSIEPAPA